MGADIAFAGIALPFVFATERREVLRRDGDLGVAGGAPDGVENALSGVWVVSDSVASSAGGDAAVA
jgi:hypothetical protein